MPWLRRRLTDLSAGTGIRSVRVEANFTAFLQLLIRVDAIDLFELVGRRPLAGGDLTQRVPGLRVDDVLAAPPGGSVRRPRRLTGLPARTG